MAPGKITPQLYGKRGELHAFGEMLRRGLVPYAPLVDVEGIDCLVRGAHGGWIEVQVRAINTPATPKLWIVGEVPDRDDYFLVLLGPEPFADERTWVLPGRSARPYVTTGTLDLSARVGRSGPPREELLGQHRGAWDLLVGKAAKEETKK